ncbi:MAG: hypothetical protein LBI01_05050 [Elusimicrobium sp.]|jgi:HAMP domain-containing protein|nr:hypothetical protein [Elusimicrobium sp.]
MRLSLKWFVAYAATALYVAIVGGIFFFNNYVFIFGEKLQQEIAEEVRARVPVMVTALAANRPQVTFSETEMMNNWVRSDDRIQSIIYLNRNASIRWHKTGDYIGKSYDDARAEDVFATNAVAQTYMKQMPKVVMYGSGMYYDMAFPLRGAQDEVVGIVNLQISRQSAKELIARAMVGYAVSCIVVFIIMGIILYIFIYVKVVSPLNGLSNAVDSISLKDLKLNYKERNDEIGGVAESVSGFLSRVKKEFKGMEAQSKKKEETEQLWWKALLAVAISKGSRAVVVDSDNNIMFANFEINVKKDGPLHLLDIFDGQQSEVITIIGKAMDTPGKVFKGETSVGDTKYVIKAVQLPAQDGELRTMIVLEPEK